MLALTSIQQITIWLIPLLFAITLHEVAHGWLAWKLGDPTAKLLGRLTINPIKHIDIFGTLFVPLLLLVLTNFKMTFGWAKPVPITWTNFSNPRRDSALVAFAGPFANLLMALIWGFIIKIAMQFNPAQNNISLFLVLSGQIGIIVNVLLMVLNLLPIPPLDGGRILTSLLPPKLAQKLSRIEPFGIFILIFLLISGLLHYLIIPPMLLLQHLIKLVINI